MKKILILTAIIIPIFMLNISFAEEKIELKISVVVPLKYTKAKDMQSVLTTLLPNVKIYADEDRNVISIYDTLANIEEAKKVITTNDIPYRQAIIAVNVAEVSHSKSKKLGWELTNYNVSFQTLLPPKFQTLSTNSISEIFPGLVSFGAENADVNILATPKIMVVGKQKASITAGDKIPIPITQSQVVSGQLAQTTTIQFEEVGIKLQVTPYIFADEDEIGLEISGEVSSIGKTTAQGYPQIITRTFTTYIRLKDNWTAILGGLLKEETRETRVGIPFLMDIPLVGYLFGSTKHENIVTEVKIFITPTLVKESMLTPPSPVTPTDKKEENSK